MTKSKDQAHARLISAAPDLLSALKGMVREWDDSDQDGIEWTSNIQRMRTRLITSARNAIARAEVE